MDKTLTLEASVPRAFARAGDRSPSILRDRVLLLLRRGVWTTSRTTTLHAVSPVPVIADPTKDSCAREESSGKSQRAAKFRQRKARITLEPDAYGSAHVARQTLREATTRLRAQVFGDDT